MKITYMHLGTGMLPMLVEEIYGCADFHFAQQKLKSLVWQNYADCVAS